MQGHARCIDHQIRDILKNKKFNLILHACLGEPLLSVSAGQAVNHGFFDNALAVGQRLQLAFDGVPFDGKCVIPPDPILPRERFGPLKERIKTLCGEATDEQQDPLGAPQTDIRARQSGFVPLKKDPPVHGFRAGKSQCIQFFPERFFQPEQAGCDIV